MPPVSLDTPARTLAKTGAVGDSHAPESRPGSWAPWPGFLDRPRRRPRWRRRNALGPSVGPPLGRARLPQSHSRLTVGLAPDPRHTGSPLRVESAGLSGVHARTTRTSEEGTRTFGVRLDARVGLDTPARTLAKTGAVGDCHAPGLTGSLLSRLPTVFCATMAAKQPRQGRADRSPGRPPEPWGSRANPQKSPRRGRFSLVRERHGCRGLNRPLRGLCAGGRFSRWSPWATVRSPAGRRAEDCAGADRNRGRVRRAGP